MLCGNNLVNYRLCFWLYSRYFMCAVMLHSDSWALWCCEDGETVKSKQICTPGPEFCLASDSVMSLVLLVCLFSGQ